NFYPPNGFVNLINQPYMPMPSQPLGENFHFVGLTQNFNTSLPPPPPPNAKRTQKPSRLAKGTIQIDGDGDATTEESKAVKKRYWTHDEEVRLASACAVSKMHTSGYSDDQPEARAKDKPREDIAEDGAEIIRTFILENLLCELKCFRVCLCELNYFCEMKGLLNSLLDDFLAEDNIMDDVTTFSTHSAIRQLANGTLKKFVEGIIARISWHVGEY
ncbi:hypothetical protein ACJX0J_022059, partial [Zea mays]